MKQKWKDIPGWVGLYQVSDYGQVRSLDRVIKYKPFGKLVNRKSKGRVLVQMTAPNGYKKVSLTSGKKRIQRNIHVLVMLAFIGPRPKKFEICHNNGIKHDNRLCNLRYDTSSANKYDRVKHV